MKDKKEIIDDNLVKMKFVTVDHLVPQLLDFVSKNNPNADTDQVPLMATQLTGGSRDYMKWVKQQFVEADKDEKKDEDSPDDDANVQSGEIEKVRIHHTGFDNAKKSKSAAAQIN
jgi:hypothetical protein